jgi:amino acid adenylation domain-containing protein
MIRERRKRQRKRRKHCVINGNEQSVRPRELSAVKRELFASLLDKQGIKQTQSIARRDVSVPPPLSFAQQRLWFLNQLEPGNAAYNIAQAVRFKGVLDVPALKRSLSEIVRRHEVLRTTFSTVDDRPVQVIHPASPVSLPVEDLTALADDEREARIAAAIKAEAVTPFDLGSGPLMRAKLLRVGDDEHIALFALHHIISDGWSASVLNEELRIIYGAFSRGEESPLPDLPLQYADYAVWQRERLQGEVLAEHLAYWEGQLGGAAVLALPADRPRRGQHSSRGSRQVFALSEETSEALKKLSRQENVTLFMTLLAAFNVLLQRYAGQDDIMIGTPVANRSRVELEKLIGFFINALVLRTDLSGDPSFTGLLKRVREVTLDAYKHQDAPFEMLVERLQPERDLNYTPLFQVQFQLDTAPKQALQSPGLTFSEVNSEMEIAQFDLSLNLQEAPHALVGSLEYNTDLFDHATIERMLRHYRNLLEGIVARPAARISELPLLDSTEREQLLVEWNETREDFSAPLCLHELFEAQAARTPDATALIFDDERLSYRELNLKANRLARQLRAVGVCAEVRVGVCVERSPEMIVALLGILKAGGAYVPLDPEYPRERLAFIAGDSNLAALVTQRRVQEKLPELEAQAVVLIEDVDMDGSDASATENLASGVVADNVAYMIYTSGSTGRPKGVVVSHRAIRNRLLWMQHKFPVEAADRVLQKTAYSFDASIWEIFVPLLAGAQVVIARPGGQQDSAYLVNAVREHEVTVLQLVPSMLRVVLTEDAFADCVSLRRMFCGGEALMREDVTRFRERLGAELHNLYGPTEAAIDATHFNCLEETAGVVVPIGKPISNMEVYILDRHLRVVPVGVAGELYIGGVNLARGYHQRPDLTAEKFIPHPFSRTEGARLYRTGDRARFLPDGNIEYLGRLDHQVKLRGFRIEPGEIEAALQAHRLVRECAVLLTGDGDVDQRLRAYVVTVEGVDTEGGELREWLRRSLPDYMIPTTFVLLEELPRTPNGKLDRRALLQHSQPETIPASRHVAPRNPLEEVLAGIWAEVLGVERVGIHDNFFELGGHSLLATQVVSRVRKVLQVELGLREFFESPTVAELVGSIAALRRGDAQSNMPPLTRSERDPQGMPLSFAQQRLWFIDQLAPGSPVYNIPFSFRMMGELNVKAIEQTLCEIARRHEVLRTTFAKRDGRPVQLIAEAADFTLPLTDLTALADEEQRREVTRIAREEAQEPFDLSRGPLMRAMLLRLAADEHVMLFTLHHIVSDGWSMGVLIEEVASLYKTFAAGAPPSLAELPIQYADYAAWQREWLSGERLQSHLDYWRRRLSGSSSTLKSLTKASRQSRTDFRGEAQSFALPADLSKHLKALGQREGSTLFMTLLAAFATLLHRHTGQDDIVLGTDVANRNRIETESLIGFFVNVLVLRTDLTGNPTFRELLARVRGTTLEAYEHQDLPFEKLVEELQPDRALSGTPLFQAKLILQNAPLQQLELAGLMLTPLDIEADATGTAKFDLYLTVADTERGLEGTLAYSTALFDAATIGQLLKSFTALLSSIVLNPDAHLSELEILSAAGRERLVEEKRKRYESNMSKLKSIKPRAISTTRRRVGEAHPRSDQEQAERES